MYIYILYIHYLVFTHIIANSILPCYTFNSYLTNPATQTKTTMILISRFYMILCVIIFLTINVIITQSQFIEPTIDILDDGNIYNNNNINYSSPGVNDHKTFLPRHLKTRKSIHNMNAYRHVRRLNDNIYSYPFNHIYTHGSKKTIIIKYDLNGLSGNVISNEDLLKMFAKFQEYVDVQSYGKVTLETPVIHPTIVSINTNNGFFDEVDKCRVAAGYDYNNYDYELFWKNAGSGSVGGSAVPGGRVQIFKYSSAGHYNSFQNKILPHEFMHNFGCGHAWHKAQTYGDSYDILGGGAMDPDNLRVAHISAGTKHRFGWIPDEHVTSLTKANNADSEYTIELRPYDRKDAISRLTSGQKLAIRIETEYINGKPCPSGKRDWCPWWEGNQNNDWYSTVGTTQNIYLYISYRGSTDIQGASLHLVSYPDDGWVRATSSIDIRSLTQTQSDSFIKQGEIYIFESNSQTSIEIKTIYADDDLLKIKVKYINGKQMNENYEIDNAATLCEHTLSCGKQVEVAFDSNSNDGRKQTSLIKIGETHSSNSVIAACSQQVSNLKTYIYNEFPAVQIFHGGDVLIDAKATLQDFCAASVIQAFNIAKDATGDWMIDGGKFRLEDYKYYDTDAGIVDSIDRYPHYIADFHTWKVHVYMCKCNYYYCKQDHWKEYNGNKPVGGWFWIMYYNAMNNVMGYQGSWMIPIPNENFTDVVNLKKTYGLRWLKGNGGYAPTFQKDPGYDPYFNVEFLQQNGVQEKIGQLSGSRGWLIAQYDKTTATHGNTSSLKYKAHSCTIQECTVGSYNIPNSDDSTTTTTNSACKLCKQCPSGYTTLNSVDFLGSRSCFYNSKQINVQIEGWPTNKPNISGIYTAKDDLFNGSPVYAKASTENVGPSYNGLILRKMGFGSPTAKWKFTYGSNPGQLGMESGYGTDLENECNCINVMYPQLLPSANCVADTYYNDKCSSSSNNPKKIPFKNSDKIYYITITEYGYVNNDKNNGNTNETDDFIGCTCATHTHSGKKAHCLTPTEIKLETCKWITYDENTVIVATITQTLDIKIEQKINNKQNLEEILKNNKYKIRTGIANALGLPTKYVIIIEITKVVDSRRRRLILAKEERFKIVYEVQITNNFESQIDTITETMTSTAFETQLQETIATSTGIPEETITMNLNEPEAKTLESNEQNNTNMKEKKNNDVLGIIILYTILIIFGLCCCIGIILVIVIRQRKAKETKDVFTRFSNARKSKKQSVVAKDETMIELHNVAVAVDISQQPPHAISPRDRKKLDEKEGYEPKMTAI